MGQSWMTDSEVAGMSADAVGGTYVNIEGGIYDVKDECTRIHPPS